MRLLCEVFVIGALLYTGWETPWNQRLPWLVSSQAANQPSAARSEVTPKPAAQVDRPAYNKAQSFTGHIFYVDPDGKKYWLDAQGNRRYER
ncbi:MAG TPA: hypothetical protein VGM62_03815 [Chthoniobacterales bacterium]|jgi:hypothetical protein